MRALVRGTLQSFVLILTGVFVSQFSRGTETFIEADTLAVGLATTILLVMMLGATGGPEATFGHRRSQQWNPGRRIIIALSGTALVLNILLMPATIWAFLLALGATLLVRHLLLPFPSHLNPLVPITTRALATACIALYATALDWSNEMVRPATGVWLFVLLIALSMALIEIGERTPSPEARSTGQPPATPIGSPGISVAVWLVLLGLSFAASLRIGSEVWQGPIAVVPMSVVLLFSVMPAIRLFRSRGPWSGETFEAASWAWTTCTQAAIGILPAFFRLLGL